MRYLIGDLSGIRVEGYRGMDRYGGLCTSQPFDKAFLDRMEVYCACAGLEEEAEIIALYEEAVQKGGKDLELLAIDRPITPNNQHWWFLGYDVGEKNDQKDNLWSAINRHDYYASWEFLEPWEHHLNAYKLFQTKDAAEAFREYYLRESEDPVFDWSTPEQDALLYQVAAIYLYQDFPQSSTSQSLNPQQRN